ncbi:uncharacterized protein LOC142350320 isoform X1 [Convolutriloba macropyga]|uniref:uncharacterized protein LOC142350320 isoform X1 n=1 Tax=Convolutriloba macropyga TaxID=536237 RepID=UPI003F523D3D
MDYLSVHVDVQDKPNKTFELSDRSIQLKDDVENPENRCKTQNTLHKTTTPGGQTAKMTVAGEESYDNSQSNQYFSLEEDEGDSLDDSKPGSGSAARVQIIGGTTGAGNSMSSTLSGSHVPKCARGGGVAGKHSMFVALSKLQKPVLFSGVSLWGRFDLERLSNLHHSQMNRGPALHDTDLSGLTSASSSVDPSPSKKPPSNPSEPPEIEIVDDGERHPLAVHFSEENNQHVDISCEKNAFGGTDKSVVDSNFGQESSATIQSLEIREQVMSSGTEEASAKNEMGSNKVPGETDVDGSPQFGGSCWQRCFRKSSKSKKSA